MSDGKWIPDLSPEMPVVDAARTVLAARFGVVRHYLPLAAESPFDNPEYVHQLRVGTRRAGAALRVFADCLPKKPQRAAKKSLRAIRRAAGGARDWDVFLDNLAAVIAWLYGPIALGAFSVMMLRSSCPIAVTLLGSAL